MFLEHWDKQKILSSILQRFSYLLDEWIAKICKKKISRRLFKKKDIVKIWSVCIAIECFLRFVMLSSIYPDWECFSPLFGQIGLKLIEIDQTCSNWIKQDQTCSNLIQLDQIGSMWFKMDPIGSNLIKLDQIGLKLIRIDQSCSKLFKVVQSCSNWIKLVQTCMWEP